MDSPGGVRAAPAGEVLASATADLRFVGRPYYLSVVHEVAGKFSWLADHEGLAENGSSGV